MTSLFQILTVAKFVEGSIQVPSANLDLSFLTVIPNLVEGSVQDNLVSYVQTYGGLLLKYQILQ